jgi:hypothetical protein
MAAVGEGLAMPGASAHLGATPAAETQVPRSPGSDVADQIHDPALGVDLQEDVVPSRVIDFGETLVSVSRE